MLEKKVRSKGKGDKGFSISESNFRAMTQIFVMFIKSGYMGPG